MATKVIKYPLDRTGKSKDNLVLSEPHIVPRDKSRTFATLYGPFYSDSLVVRLRGSVTPLKLGEDYKVIMLYQDATIALGMPVSGGVIITNKALGTNIEIDYQVVGGPFSLSSYAISDMFDALELDNRKVNWIDILGKPVRFPPAPHLHDADDLYGMEDVIAALTSLRLSILTGDIASHEQIYDYIDRIKALIYIDLDKINERLDLVLDELSKLKQQVQDSVDKAIADLTKALNDHINDRANPHQTNKEQVGLGNVQNYAPSTNANALDENNNSTYLTPSALWNVLKTKVLNVFNDHLKDYNNPHKVTKAQVGLSDVPNLPMASQLEAEAATTNDRFMSPLRVMQLVTAKVMPTINTHIANTSNPHKVTTDQIGAVPTSRKVQGKTLTGDISFNASDFDAYTKGEVNDLINGLRNEVNSSAGGVKMGPATSFKERRANERMAGGVMTAWADYGSSNYWVVLRPLYFWKNNNWNLTPYE